MCIGPAGPGTVFNQTEQNLQTQGFGRFGSFVGAGLASRNPAIQEAFTNLGSAGGGTLLTQGASQQTSVGTAPTRGGRTRVSR